MPRKGERLRGIHLASELEKTGIFRGVAEARVRQRYLPADYKVRHFISLNIYDAAHSYKETHGDPRGIRAILADTEFRNAWNTFRGGWRWKYDTEKSEWVKV